MITERSRKIPSFIVMDILERAQALERQGRHIIHLEVGEPDFQTPACICQAAQEAIEHGLTHYTHSLGLIELREAISRHYEKTYGVIVDPGRIIVTSGTSPGLFMLYSVLLEAEDEIIISDPHYPCYPNFAEFLQATPVFVKVEAEDGFQLNPEAVRDKIGPRTKAVMINSPANPMGSLLSRDSIEEIASLGPLIISDEIYHGLVYGEKEHSILEFTQNAFVINGFSKTYAMTGWRLGYVIVPEFFVRPLQKIQQNFFISAGSIAQWAGLAALNHAGPDVAKMKDVYDGRRRYMIERLRDLGFILPVEPAGAFYILVNVRHLSSDSYKLAMKFLEEAGVGVAPGIDFGAQGEGFLRFSYANSLENIKEGLDRIEKIL